MAVNAVPDGGTPGGPSAALQFTQVTLQDQADPTNTFPTNAATRGSTAWSSDYSVNAERHVYAGGRKRVIRMPGTDQDRAVTFPWVHPDDVDWLRAKLGAALLYRDSFGNFFGCTYLTIKVTEFAMCDGFASVDVTFSEVDIVQGV